MTWAAIRWLPLMFLVSPAMEAPLVAHLSDPVKPLKVWVGNASWYGPGNRIRNVVKFQVEENVRAQLSDLADRVGARACKQLAADLEHPDEAAHLLREVQRCR